MEIGRYRKLCQLLRPLVVIMLDGIRDHKIFAVGAEGTALRQEPGKSGIPFRVISRPGVHDAQSKALDLLRKQAHPVKLSGLVLIALQKRRFRQRIHRIRNRAEQSLKLLFSGHPGVMADDLGIILKLIHPDVLHAGAHRRDSLGSDKDEDVAVKQLFRRNHVHLRKRIILPWIGDLVYLKLPAGRHLLRKIADSDGGDHIPAQKMETR